MVSASSKTGRFVACKLTDEVARAWVRVIVSIHERETQREVLSAESQQRADAPPGRSRNDRTAKRDTLPTSSD